MDSSPASATGLKVALFLPSLAGGGAERVAVNLIEGLEPAGHTVDVVAVSAFGEYVNQIPPTVRIVDLRAKRALTSFLPLTRYLRASKPDMLISSLGHTNLVALAALRASGSKTKIIVTEHLALHEEPQDLVDRLFRILARWMYPKAHAVVAVSNGVADTVSRGVGLPRKDVDVVYNPVLPRAFWEKAKQPVDHPWFAQNQPPVILGVGRLTAQKDFPNLLEAFARVRRTRDARLMILGEGPDREALEDLASELGVADHVSMPGFVDNPYAYMAASSLFVLSSRREGLPTVLIEALATGVPVVSTDCPSGPVEILRGGELGALVPIEDPAALADAIVEALLSPSPSLPPDALEAYTPDAASMNYLRLVQH